MRLPALLASLASLALIACADETGHHVANTTTTDTLRIPGIDSFVDVKLLTANTTGPVDPQMLGTYETAIGSETDIDGIVKKMGGGTNMKLGRRLEQTRARGRSAGNPPPGLKGIGGIPGHILLDAASDKLGNNNDWSMGTIVEVTGRKGRITDYDYGAGGNPGRMTVEVEVYWRKTLPGNADKNAEAKLAVERYKVEVEVDGGFENIAKDPTDPGDVFPGSGILIPATMADNYTFKVYKVGTSIMTKALWIDRNGNGSFDAVEKITPADLMGWKGAYRSVFDTDEHNCIDMMVDVADEASIPKTLADLKQLLDSSGRPLQYCLGRCQNPPLINTK